MQLELIKGKIRRNIFLHLLYIYLHFYRIKVSNFEQVLEATSHNAPAVRPPTSHHENYQS